MEPVTGSVYIVLFVVIVGIRHTESKRPERKQYLEDLKDRLYVAAIGYEALVATLLAMLLH